MKAARRGVRMTKTSLAALFAALANEHRLAIVAELCRAQVANPHTETASLSISNIAIGAEMTRFAASYHLAELRDTEFVVGERDGGRHQFV